MPPVLTGARQTTISSFQRPEPWSRHKHVYLRLVASKSARPSGLYLVAVGLPNNKQEGARTIAQRER